MARVSRLPIRKTPAEAGKRARAALEIGRARQLERGYRKKSGSITFNSGVRNNRSISEYEEILGLGPESIRKLFLQKIKSHGKINVLDVGCGAGVFLSQAGRLAHWKANVEGITVGKPVGKQSIKELKKEAGLLFRLKPSSILGFGRLGLNRAALESNAKKSKINFHTGLAETHSYGKKFDLIFSVNTFQYFINKKLALINTLNHLKNGGQAYLHFNRPARELLDLEGFGGSKNLREFLEKNGFEIQYLRDSACLFTKRTDADISLEIAG
jgi:SAM-dependent methyltransferase